MEWQTTHLEQFHDTARKILKILETSVSSEQATVVCLHGDLGAGKTTMTQVIAKELGVTETIQSPTFVIRKAYETRSSVFKKMIHIDAYRIEPDEGLDIFHFEQDFSSPNTLVIIEWPEMIKSSIPIASFHVFIEHAGEGRVIRFENKKTA